MLYLVHHGKTFYGISILEKVDQSLHRCMAAKHDKQEVRLDIGVATDCTNIYDNYDTASEQTYTAQNCINHNRLMTNAHPAYYTSKTCHKRCSQRYNLQSRSPLQSKLQAMFAGSTQRIIYFGSTNGVSNKTSLDSIPGFASLGFRHKNLQNQQLLYYPAALISPHELSGMLQGHVCTALKSLL